MPVVTVTDLNNAKEDANDLSSLVNSSESTVETRTGGSKPTYSALIGRISHGDITTYDPTATYTAITDWVEYTSGSPSSTVVYRPIPSALPISPTSPLTTAPDANKWEVAAGYKLGDRLIPAVSSYADLRNINTAGLTDGTPIEVTNSGIAGTFILRNSVAHGLSDNGGTIIVIDSDWYAERVFEGPALAEWFGAKTTQEESNFDNIDAFEAALAAHNNVVLGSTGTYYISRKLTYPGNAYTFGGLQSSPFSSNTIIQPLDNTFSDDCVIDLNESGSESGTEGGQFNRLLNVTIRGGMADYTNAADPLVALVGVKFKNTRDTCGLYNVSFRECGVPFEGEGYVHWLEKVYVYQCYQGPELISTNSSSIDTYVIQTCAKNWGTLQNCNVHNATIQQGNENQTLDDDLGVTCTGNVNFTGYLYTEGGSAQLNLSANAVVTVENWEMGFAQLTAGGFGNHNAAVASGSRLIVKGGKSSGVKSYLIGGSPDDADRIHLDINPYDSRIINSAGTVELPECPNLYVKRTYGTINRVDGYNEITLPRYDIGVSTVTIWDQFITPGAQPFGGEIIVSVGGSFSYDLYRVDFSDGSSTAENVTINTIYRNTGGSGDNNIILSYSTPNLTAQGRKSDQKISVKVTGYGSMWPKAIA